MFKYIKEHNIPFILAILVLGMGFLSYYNYKEQQNLLVLQMQNNSESISSSVSSAVERFEDIKSTMSLQKLLNDVSFGLEIFEFRFLDPDGTIHNSMFKEEIGKIYDSPSFTKTLLGDSKMKHFFFEVRDYVDVMAIHYPIYTNNDLVGIIDLSVDISEYNVLKNYNEDFSILRRQADILNLLKSIEGSITNSLSVSAKTDMHAFLKAYINSTENILQISLLDTNNIVYTSSSARLVGTILGSDTVSKIGLSTKKGKPIFTTITNSNIFKNNKELKLMLVIDASTYADHEYKLLRTALIVTVITLLFALFITRTIYFSAIKQASKEKERLEHLVKERTRAIEILSKTDALTGLWNRRYLEEMLEMEFKRARRHDHDISIMVIDLDYFKRVNDTYGHMAGDEVLRAISNRIADCLRETDFIGRYGGEELVVILPVTEQDIAKEIANKILLKISEKPVMFESKDINITASIGMSHLRVEHHDHLMVFAEADEALYTAKENGRNRIEIFDIRTQEPKA